MLQTTVSSGVRTYRVRNGGEQGELYIIKAFGAKGGNARNNDQNYRGGRGALAWGIFNLTNNTMLNVAIGQSGDVCQGSCDSAGGGGGGGSFLWKDGQAEPMLVGGGGGGGSYHSTGDSYW